MTNYIKIFDTTLRDGQQCPGAGMSFEDNLHYARLAAKMGVDILEAGFPSASKLDFNIVETIAKEVAGDDKNTMIVAGLCQLREAQLDITVEALKPLIARKQARVHTYLPVDPELLKASLGDKANDKQFLMNEVERLVKRAFDAGCEVEFSPEGYSQMGENFNFATDVIRAAIRGGATTINCPDTIGGAHKFQGEEYFVEKIKKHAEIMKKEFPEAEITWSCHNHNDFGTAVENTINAVFSGPVRQIEVTINGLGERAGNASLEQTVMLIKHYAQDAEKNGVVNQVLKTGICTEKLQEVSDFVAEKMLPRQPNWPITGANAACHTSGGHTNAILNNPLVYQPFDPKEVGKEISFVFGPLSGGNHAQDVIQQAGFICEDFEKAKIAQFIKDFYSDRRKGITNEELLIAYFDYRAAIKITEFDYSKAANKASVHLVGKFFDQEDLEQEKEGKDSALSALKYAIDTKFPGIIIQNHSSNSDTEGVSAHSVSTIIIADANKQLFTGKGVDEDIEVSAMKALIDAVNQAYVVEKFKK